MTPFNPRVASVLWSKSVPGAVDVLLGVFSTPVTPSKLANVDGDVFFGAFVSIEKDLEFETDFNTSTKASRDTYIGELCSDVVGITCPHPVGQARRTACEVDDTPDLNSVSAEGDPARGAHMIAHVDRSIRGQVTGFDWSRRGRMHHIREGERSIWPRSCHSESSSRRECVSPGKGFGALRKAQGCSSFA